MNLKVRFFWLLASVSLLINYGYAQIEDELWNLEFGGYIQEASWASTSTTVETGSKQKQTVQEAPAHIYVLTAQQIEDLGAQTLAEALSYVPGITVIETFFGYTDIVFRGNFQENYNNKSLLLINGHPSWEVINGSFHLEMIPLNSIKQVEIIRGPGSVLYGTNAYAGVINVITKSGSDVKGGVVSALGGSNNQLTFGALYGSGEKDGDFEMFVAVTYADNDGYDFKIDNDEAGKSGTIEYEDDTNNITINSRFKNVRLNLGWFEQDRQKVGVIPTFASGGPSNFEGYYADLSYRSNISDAVSVYGRLRYDYIEKLLKVAQLGPETGIGLDQEGKKYGAEVGISWNLNEDISLDIGVNSDKFETEPYHWLIESTGALSRFTAYLNSYDTTEDSFFTELNWQIIEPIKLVVGGRYTDNEITGTQSQPSFGIITKLAEKKYLKLLYGSAFRNPSFFEQYVNTAGVLIGNADLDPETIDTIDLVLDMSFADKYRLVIDYFNLSTKDTIQRTTVGVPQYINGDGYEIQGIEAEISGNVSKELAFFANLTLKDGELDNGDDIPYMETINSNIGLTIRPISKLSIIPNVQYVGEREFEANSVDAYTLVHLSLKYKVSDKFSCSIIGRNILDEEYTYPEYIRRRIDDIGTGAGASVYGKIEVLF